MHLGLNARGGGGPTGGGNPIFRCADCGVSSSAFGPECICWCGYSHRGQNLTAYRCVAFTELKDKPELKQKLLACGYDPDRKTSEVGIIVDE